MDILERVMRETTDAISFRGRKWGVAKAERSATDALVKQGLNPIAARILATRNIKPEGLDEFINPTLKQSMPDPLYFIDMDRAIARMADAIQEGERIGIWSDYDCDGATSGYVLAEFLESIGHHDYVLRIPDRIKEGYGPNTAGLVDMKERQGCNFITILDAGITAYEPLLAAKQAGIDVVVLDHHTAEAEIPEGVAIVNPNRLDQPEGFGYLCAAGLTFIFVVGVTRELRNRDFFNGRLQTPDLMALLPIVALGTICDVMLLVGLNRAFVYQGLKRAQSRGIHGLRELARVAGIEEGKSITEKHFGWQIGPRINAGGRIGDALLGALALLEKDPVVAKQRAEELDQLNVTRKEIEKGMTLAAIEQMGERVAGRDRTLALAVVDGHEGVVGISAGRLRETFDAPAIVLTEDHAGDIKGSARSIGDFNIGDAIIEARKRGIIIKGGGHGAAGGLTLSREKLPEFMAFMNKEIEKTDYFKHGVIAEADIALSIPELTVDAVESFEVLRPFGNGNPEPRVIIQGAFFSELKVMKDVHYKLILESGDQRIDALIWNAAGTPIGDKILDARGTRIDILGEAGINEFRGRKSVQLMIEDIRNAE